MHLSLIATVKVESSERWTTTLFTEKQHIAKLTF